MEVRSFEAIVGALNDHGVRYLLVGGMAVVAHGHGRMTHDLDFVIALDSDNILRTFRALAGLGYQPRVPVTAEALANPDHRLRWIEEKGMTVLNLYSETHRATPVDLFVTEPFDFDDVYARSIETDVEGVRFRYVDLQTLIRMKEAAGRPVDVDDIRHLRLLADDE
jgi:predicted nucleotidyltransferase